MVIAGLIQNLAISVTGMIDCAVVGRYLGVGSLSAMKLAWPVFSLESIFGTILSTGLSVVVSRELTRGRTERAQTAFQTVIGVTAVIAAVSMLAGIAFPSAVTRLLAGSALEPAIFSETTDYLVPILLAALPILIYDIFSTLILLEGADRYMRVSSAVILAVNIVGDLLAVRLHMGLMGIAVSSAAAYLLAFLVAASFFVSGRSMFRIRIRKPDHGALLDVVKAGLPMIMRGLSGILWPMAVNRLMLKYGSISGLAALSIQNAVHYLPAALCSGIAGTALIMTGIYVGEQDIDGLKQLRDQVVRWSLIGGVAVGVVLGLSARMVLRLFTTDEEVLTLSSTALYCFLGGVPFLALNYSAASFLQSVGRRKASGAVIFINHVVISISMASALALSFGEYGIFASFWAGELAMTVLLAAALFVVFRKYGLAKLAGIGRIEDEMRCDIGTVEDGVAASVQLGEFCRRNGGSSRIAYHIALCAEELAINNIEHGFNDGKPHVLKLRAAVSEGMLTLRLRDDCRQFNLVERYRMVKQKEDDPAKNIGLRIIFASADDVSYSSALNLNNVCVKIRLV